MKVERGVLNQAMNVSTTDNQHLNCKMLHGGTLLQPKRNRSAAAIKRRFTHIQMKAKKKKNFHQTLVWTFAKLWPKSGKDQKIKKGLCRKFELTSASVL